MTVSLGWRYNFAEYDHHNGAGNARLRRFAGAALVSIGFACAWTLWTNLAGGGGDRITESPAAVGSGFVNVREASAARGGVCQACGGAEQHAAIGGVTHFWFAVRASPAGICTGNVCKDRRGRSRRTAARSVVTANNKL